MEVEEKHNGNNQYKDLQWNHSWFVFLFFEKSKYGWIENLGRDGWDQDLELMCLEKS